MWLGTEQLVVRDSLLLLAPESGKARLEVLRSRMLMLLHATWQPDSPSQQFSAHSQEEGRGGCPSAKSEMM